MTDRNTPQQGDLSSGDATPRMPFPYPIHKLTALEVRTMMLVYERNTAKDIARIERVTPDAVVARINRARNKLGGISRLAAARLIMAALPPSTNHSMIPQPMGIGEIQSSLQNDIAIAEDVVSDRMPQGIWKLPLPTKARPVNDDPLLARIIWPVVVSVLIVVMMAILQAVMVGLDRLRL